MTKVVDPKQIMSEATADYIALAKLILQLMPEEADSLDKPYKISDAASRTIAYHFFTRL